MKNWKTSVTGILAIIGAVWHAYTTGTVGGEDIATVLTGVGLIFAKDLNVTGGTKQQ